jgi:hypothetical protein
MNLKACAILPTLPEVGTWYRVVDPQYLTLALQTSHTISYPSRFSEGQLGKPPFEILYLAENHMVALFEVEALFGSSLNPGRTVANPARPWVILNVQVSLKSVVNLTDVAAAHVPLQTTAQELTGDWRGYISRNPGTKVQQPTGAAPTQDLGAALYGAGKYEGFRTLSAKLPYNEILAVFPKRLQGGSFIRYYYTDATGHVQTFSIP